MVKIPFSLAKNPRHVNEELVVRRESLVRELSDYACTIRCMRNGEIRRGTKGSLSVRADGSYFNFQSERGGDLLSLIMEELECSFNDALEYAIEFIRRTSPDVSVSSYTQPRDEHSTEAFAKKLWIRATKPGEQEFKKLLRYLHKRDINTPPSAALCKLGFLPAHKYAETGEYFPCGLVKLQYPYGEFAGIQRIYLTDNCRSKAPVTSPKMALGTASSGAAMQLTKLAPTLYIAEGLENALSLMQMYPGIAVWGYVGANILSCTFPPGVEKVVIATDADAQGEHYRQALSRRLLAEGYRVGTLTVDA